MCSVRRALPPDGPTGEGERCDRRSKFKAVNNRDRNFTTAKVEKRRRQLQESVARYLSQLDTADLHEPSESVDLKKTYLKEKLEKLKSEMAKLEAIERQVLASPDQQISLTDPDCRSMATSGRGSGVVGYNVQTAVDTEHHLIVAHEVTNVGNDTAHLANTAKAAKAALHVEELEAVADRGYFDGEEILACDRAGITVTLPKRMNRARNRKAVLASRTSSIWPMKMSIVVRLARGLSTIIRMRRKARSCTAIGRLRAAPAR